MVLLKFVRKDVILEKDDIFDGVVYKCMVLLKFVRKDVILRSVAPFKDDIFEGVVYKCSAQILEEPK
jgi:hypothetical protein